MVRGTRASVRVAGVAMLAVAVAAVALTGAAYTRAFSSSVDITVATARAGLVMDPGNTVKYRGVEVGRVTSVTRIEDGVQIKLALDPQQAGGITANVGAAVRASTIFGAKYVALTDPPRPSEEAIEAGAVIDARGVTREINTLFERVHGVVSRVDVVALNTTLSTLSGALDGRGRRIAALASTADRYLARLQPALPQLRRDLRQMAELSNLGVRVAPAVLRILDNATTTSRSIVSTRQALDRLLLDLVLLGQTGSEVLGSNAERIVRVLERLRPTTGLLSDYASELPCLLKGLQRSGKLALGGAGGTSPGLNLLSTLRGPTPQYEGRQDRPAVPHGTGPACGSLPYLAPGDVPAPEVE